MAAIVHSVVAVDGTAASGKSTFSRMLARRIGAVYVSTGEMYRGVTWYIVDKGINPRDSAAVEKAFEAARVETTLGEGAMIFTIDGIDPLPHGRDGAVNDGVSYIARVSAVRRVLVAQQQRLAYLSPLVMEGRDIGTVVFPQTPYKFYVDASAEVRAARRAAQGEQDSIAQRDAIDTQRVDSPLTCAPDALRLDSGAHSPEELVETALEHLAKLGFKPETASP